MSMGPGIVGPANFPIRDPKSRPMNQGRIKNPRGKDFEMGGRITTFRKNDMAVERPTGVTATVRTSERD